MAIDASGKIYALNTCDPLTITVYAKGSNGDAAPTAIIGGSNWGGNNPSSMAVDSSGNIYVADVGDVEPPDNPPVPASVFVYAAGSNGNVAPIATISGSNTGLTYPTGVAVDSSGNIYVADYYALSVFVYPPLGSSTGFLNEAPIAAISGDNTGLYLPTGIAVDSSRNIYVADEGISDSIIYPPSVYVYSAGSNGDAFPIATISGSKTELSSPVAIALDSNRNIYVPDKGAGSVFVYPPLGSSSGQLNVAPTATISGINIGLNVGIITGLVYPYSFALDSSGNIYTTNQVPASVTVYPPLGSSTGEVHETPIATISTALTTGLRSPEGVALDSSGKIYVVDDGPDYSGPDSVFVYAAGSNANAAPIATISGSKTGLSGAIGITLDSSGKIYVADGEAESVFIYSALGSRTGLLNEAPIATISGSNTGLGYPYGIALDSSGNIYVTAVYYAGDIYVLVYPPVGSSTGTLNESPTAFIFGSDTGLSNPQGIALDSSGNIYVDQDDDSVMVYPALGSSTGKVNEFPTATITPETGSSYGGSVALDSSGNIYVTGYLPPGDNVAGVFTYPPLGSSTGVLDEAPIATIGGTLTELINPQFVAIGPAAGPPPSPTATATGGTPTATATATKTATPTATATSTGSTTPTATATATPTATPTAVAVTLKIAPKSLEFPKTTVGTSSKPKTVKVSNPKGNKKHPGLPVLIEMISGDPVFTETNDCPPTLVPGAICSITVTFTPNAAAEQFGSLVITDNANGGWQALPLSGTGKAPKTKK